MIQALDESRPRLQPTVVDAFCGAGGMSLGFFNAGFNILYAFDNDGPSLDTYKNHFPNACVAMEDIRKVTANSIRSALERDASIPETFGSKALDDLDVLIGGPPCQGFSNQNVDGHGDDRNQLIWEFLRLVSELRPRIFLLENVRGLVGKRGSTITNQLPKWADQTNYKIAWRLLNSKNFGVAQNRERIFIIGVTGWTTGQGRILSILSPLPGMESGSTIRDKIFDLQGDTSKIPIPNHVHASLAPINIERLQNIRPGQGRNALPDHLRLPTQTRNINNGHSETYGRLMWDEPAPTLTTSFHSISKGRFAHPTETRGLTLREGARLQGFPDDFEFKGKVLQIARQIGNAVSPPVSETLGTRIRWFMEIAISIERNSLITCESEIKFGISEFDVIQVLYSRSNDWVTIQDIEEELHKGATSIRATLERIVRKLERNAIEPSFLLEKRRGGYYRLRGVKTLEWI